MVVAGTEASNAVKERPGQREARGGAFMAILKKGRFFTFKKCFALTANDTIVDIWCPLYARRKFDHHDPPFTMKSVASTNVLLYLDHCLGT